MKLIYPSASATRSATSGSRARLREPLRGQIAGCSRAGATSLDDRSRARRLWLQAGDRSADGVRWDAVTLEVVADEQVPRAP